MFYVSISTILWFVALMTSSFFQRTWHTLEKFREINLYVKLEKCVFHQFEVEFLDYIIFGYGIRMVPCKVQTTMDWATLVLFRMFNVFLGSPIFISKSLHTLP
jgi:hypothetical protein